MQHLNNSSALKSNIPLTPEQMIRVAPSIFATEAHLSRSDRYSYLPTSEVLGALQKEGFEPFYVAQTRVKHEDRREHTKHLIRLRHTKDIQAQVNDEFNEIILLNSHDGTSSYKMMAGVFRLVCANGLVCGNSTDIIRIPHQGQIAGRVIEGAYEVLGHFKEIDEQKEKMKAITLHPVEQLIFASSALELKYEESKTPISEVQLLIPRRKADEKNDLWSVFNRIQENMMRGGLRERRPDSRLTRTRAVTGIDQNIKLNRALWTLAEKMRQLKTGA